MSHQKRWYSPSRSNHTASDATVHDLCVYIASMAHCVCLFNIRNTTYLSLIPRPLPTQGTRLLHTVPAPMVLLRVSAWSGSIRRGRHLAMSLYKLWLPKLNYALESHCLFTLSHSNRSCNWGKRHVNMHGLTAAHYYTTGRLVYLTFSQTTLTI